MIYSCCGVCWETQSSSLSPIFFIKFLSFNDKQLHFFFINKILMINVIELLGQVSGYIAYTVCHLCVTS